MAGTKTKAGPSPKEETVSTPLQYDVRIYPAKTDGSMKASATVNISGEFALTNIRVMEGSKGLFVSMPQYRGRNGEYKDICFPCTKESRAAFDKAVLGAYEQAVVQCQRENETGRQEVPDRQKQEQNSHPEMTAM